MAVNKVIYGNQTLIDLTSDTITAADLASGKTAHDKSGAIITGTNTYDADTSDADAVASEILNTKTAYVNGSKVTGTMPNRGGANITIDDLTGEAIPAGFHDGSGVVRDPADIPFQQLVQLAYMDQVGGAGFSSPAEVRAADILGRQVLAGT